MALALAVGIGAAGLGRESGALVCALAGCVWIWRGWGLGAVFCLVGFAGQVAGAVAEPAAVWSWGSERVGAWRVAEGRFGPVIGAQTVGGSPGLARPGERVAWLEGSPPKRYAGALEPGDARGRLWVEADALVRLAPVPTSLAGWAWRRVRAWWAGPDALDPRPSWRGRLLVAAAELELAGGLPPGLGQALWLGESRALDPAVTDRFTRTGTRHLLAISGLHVGIIAALLVWPLTRIGARGLGALIALFARRAGAHAKLRRLEWPLLAVALATFVVLTGAAPPVWRASFVVALGLGSSHVGRLGRRVDGLNLWGVALTFEWLAGGRAADSLSLQLSYTAALGLILFFAPTARWLRAHLRAALVIVPGLEDWRPAWARPAWTSLPVGVARLLALSLTASLVAVAATLPITWHHFGEWAPVGMVLTTVCLFPVAWLLVAGWPLMLLVALTSATGLGTALGAWSVEQLVGAPARLLGALLAWGDGLPATPWLLPARPAWCVALPLVLLVLGRTLEPRGKREQRQRQRHLFNASAWLATAALLLPWTAAPATAEVHLLAVGHGTAAVVRTERDEVWIFDAGSRDRLGVWSRALEPLLASWEAGAPHVILSHGDGDHWNALARLVERVAPAIWYGHVPAELDLPPRVPRQDLDRGAMRLRDGATRLTLLRGGELPGNEGSRSLLVETNGQRLLLSGDAEGPGLRALLDDWPPGADLDVLLMPHHGSDSPHLDALLASLRPREIWISKSGEAQLEAELTRRKQPYRTTERDGRLSWPDSTPAIETQSRLSPTMQAGAPLDLRHETNMLSLPTLALLGLLATPTLQQPQADQDADLVAAEANDWTEDRVRVLKTSYGVFIRSRSYLADGQWMVRLNREWQAFDAALITSAESVRDLEKEAKRLTKTLDLDDDDQRLELGAWYAEHGLLEEAIAQLDIVLRHNPNHPGALALLTPEHFPLRFDGVLPAPPQLSDGTDPIAAWETTTKQLLGTLSNYSPAARELVWAQLDPGFSAPENQPALMMALTTQLESSSSRQRAQAAHALRRLAPTHLDGTSTLHANAVRTLVRRAALDGTEDVRSSATYALARLDDPAVAAPFVKALASTSPAIRLHAAEALGILAVPATAPALVSALAATSAAGGISRAPASSIFIGTQKAYLQDYDVEVATGAAIGDPVVNVIQEGAVLDVRVIAAHQRIQLVHQRSALRKALKRITGQDFKYDTEAWTTWLAEHPLE